MSKARDLANAADVLDDVSATELGYVNGVTSAIQTQLDNKQAVVSGVDNTEIGYLNGVTSAIQTQIDSKIGQANAINPTIVDAKGDIIAATAADTPARLAVGTNNQVLMVDSGQATGLKYANEATATLTTTGDTLYASAANTPARLGIGTTGQVLTVSGGIPSWATPASGDKAALWMKSSGRYIKFHSRNMTSNYTPAEDLTTYVPIYLPGYALDRIGFRTSSNATNTTWRLGIYNSNSNGEPSTVYLDAGTVVATSTGTKYEITISSTPPAGYYFLAINCQVVTSGSREILAYNIDTGMQSAPFAGGTTDLSVTNYQSGWTQSGVTGAFATATSLTAFSSNVPVVVVRMA